MTQVFDAYAAYYDLLYRDRYFFAPELRLLLATAGFELASLVEWLSGDEPGFDTWSSTVVAVRRREN